MCVTTPHVAHETSTLDPCSFESRRESIVIEGVHLAPNAVMRLMAKHPSVVPFLVYIRCPLHSLGA
jgi:hypothetical protein